MFQRPEASSEIVFTNDRIGDGIGPSPQHITELVYGLNSMPPHSSHPDFPHLAMLVFEAVLEVVCVSLPGYIVARQGMFTAEMQKFTANLNVAVFTPCLS